MKIILVDQRHGHSRTIVLNGWAKTFLSFLLLGAPIGLGFFGYALAVAPNPQMYQEETALNWEAQLDAQAEQLAQIRQQSEEQLNALTQRLATMQARLIRLDAVGERITTVAGLDSGEFDFSQPVGVGGPASDYAVEFPVPEFIEAIEQLEDQLEDRRQQLEILDGLLSTRQLNAEASVTGRPVDKGWVSSRFGRRTDPFTGKLSWHEGIDFSAPKGSEIHAVAAGVVTWSAQRPGYGLMVEINHGNGYSTRYGHADQLLVQVGEIVKKQQTVGLVGTTGRSIGPHVHFEVFKNGRVVDPASYINRTIR